jgi:hypothetical protein
MDRDRADERFREWMRGNLARAADYFGLTISGAPGFGWRLRSISAPAVRCGGGYWLRVVSEEPRWLPGEFWTGNADANVLTELAKPRVLDVTEWWDEQVRRRVRAEMMTVMPGRQCSPTDVLRVAGTVSGTWWAELRRTIDQLGMTVTTRCNADQDKVDSRVRAAFGDRVELHVEQWETVHGDLHWSNLFLPEFGLLDWKLWGRGPVGTDAATLYCYSLLVPEVARQVHEVFSDVLDTPAGRLAQIHVAARLLTRAEQDFPDLIDPLRRHVQPLLD